MELSRVTSTSQIYTLLLFPKKNYVQGKWAIWRWKRGILISLHLKICWTAKVISFKFHTVKENSSWVQNILLLFTWKVLVCGKWTILGTIWAHPTSIMFLSGVHLIVWRCSCFQILHNEGGKLVDLKLLFFWKNFCLKKMGHFGPIFGTRSVTPQYLCNCSKNCFEILHVRKEDSREIQKT